MIWDANELANALVGDYGVEYIKEAASMLRQQQTEIEALKEDLSGYITNANALLNELEALKTKTLRRKKDEQ